MEHGTPRIIYCVELAKNAKEYLLGVDKKPKYYLPRSIAKKTTEEITRWWHRRWVVKRIKRKEVLQRIAKETLIHPIRHRARVELPRIDVEQGILFEQC